MAKHGQNWFKRKKDDDFDSPYDGFLLPVQGEETDFGNIRPKKAVENSPEESENIGFELFSLDFDQPAVLEPEDELILAAAKEGTKSITTDDIIELIERQQTEDILSQTQESKTAEGFAEEMQELSVGKIMDEISSDPEITSEDILKLRLEAEQEEIKEPDSIIIIEPKAAEPEIIPEPEIGIAEEVPFEFTSAAIFEQPSQTQEEDPFDLSIIGVTTTENEQFEEPSAADKKAVKESKKQQKRISREEMLIRKYEEEIERKDLKKKRTFKDFLKLILPWKGDTTGEKLTKSVLIIAIVAFFAAAIFLADYAIASAKNRSTNESIKDLYKNPNYDLTGVDFPEGANAADFGALYAQNPDTIGWIHIPNTNIDNVVVKTKDNDYYLTRDFYKKYSEHGTIMADFRSIFSVSGNSQNVTLYGHHMQDGSMFAQLEKYRTLSFYKANPVIYFDTLYAKGAYEIMSIYITNDFEEQDNGYRFNFNKINFSTEAEFYNYVTQVKRRSIFNIDVNASITDSLLTLSTCVYDFEEARLVICARKLLDGEMPRDTSTAVRNPAPLYPQAWYDKKGGTKPTFSDDDLFEGGDTFEPDNPLVSSDSTSSDAVSGENSLIGLPNIPDFNSSNIVSTGSSDTSGTGSLNSDSSATGSSDATSSGTSSAGSSSEGTSIESTPTTPSEPPVSSDPPLPDGGESQTTAPQSEG